MRNEKKGLSPQMRIYLSAAILGVIIVVCTYAGMLYACDTEGSTLVNYKCVSAVSVGTCEDVATGQQYIISDEYYKELYPDGSLSEDNYTKEYIDGLTE